MRNRKRELWVGSLVLIVIALLVLFAWLMGAIQPFARTVAYHAMYGFAGGVEVGAPVRVAGVKVGKVDRIQFVTSPGEERAVIKISLSVSRTASQSVRRDSKFFVNMAGIIGERYIEISPGGSESELLTSGAIVRGVDPPRIDQLLSQGYGVFGKIQDFIEENEETLTDFLSQMRSFLKDANRLLEGKDRHKFISLIDNLNAITGDIRLVTKKLRQPEADEVMSKLYEMMNRAYEVDKDTLKKFLQEEGIRARIF